jgi:hypothetical protein
MYFNNIYQHANNFAKGMTILETENCYVGYGGTEDPGNIGLMLLLFKIDKQGEEMIWKPFGENYHSYYFGNVGGAMIKTSDGNFALAYHAANISGIAYSTLLKLDINLDTIWKKNYSTNNLWTMTMNCRQTIDNGFILAGSVKPASGEFWDFLLLKTDSSGNMQWYNTFGTNLSEHGENVIETPDGGYLIGGFRYNPAVYHSLDALVIKTDSLGNEEWTKTYGNPYVDDDMAHVALADDGNYLIATVYGQWIFSNETRIGKQCIYKVNQQGQIIDVYYPGVSRISNFIRNFRKSNDGYILTGFSKETDSATYQYYSGWMMKVDNNLDSLWYRDYIHFNDESAENLLYDMSPCQDSGYIGIGYARPGAGGSTEKMWIIKVDSMGCDTAGCATGTFMREYSLNYSKKITAYPNPASSEITLDFQNTDHHNNILLECYNIYGQKVHTEKIWKGQQETRIDLQGWAKGLYYAVVRSEGKVAGTGRFVVR